MCGLHVFGCVRACLCVVCCVLCVCVCVCVLVVLVFVGGIFSYVVLVLLCNSEAKLNLNLWATDCNILVVGKGGCLVMPIVSPVSFNFVVVVGGYRKLIWSIL